jgi:uncharacterized protein (TIGR00661 family)
MKILYGVTGEGLGHAMRSRVVHEILRRNGHEVLVAASGRAARYLAGHGLSVVPIHGFELRYREGTLRCAATVGHTLRRAPVALRDNLAAFSEAVDPFAPELALTDFDSFAHAYAKRRGLPVISVDHHHVITRCVHDDAVRSRTSGWVALTRGVVRAKVPGCDRYIATSFYRPPVSPRCAADTRVVGPIVRPEVLALSPSRGEHVVVYQTSDSDGSLAGVLAGAPAVPFVVYGFGRDERRGNVTFRRFEEAGFLRDLSSARAVITNGGHGVIAEALLLGKPLLSVPVRHHGEQELNAAYVEVLGYGQRADRLTPEALAGFLAWSGSAAGAPRVAAGNEALAGALEEAITASRRDR